MTKNIVISLLLSFLFVVGYSTLITEIQAIKQSSQNNLQMRYNFFSQYVRLLSVQNNIVHLSIIDAYQDVKAGRYQNKPLLEGIKYFPEYDVFGLSAIDQPNIASHLKGAITVQGQAELSDPDLQHELSAVLMQDRGLSMLSGEAKLATWTYYISSKGFIYLSPQRAVKDFQFSPVFYQKPFWTDAILKNNPQHKQVISDLYEDYAGQGLMITISNPVMIGHHLLGVVSADISIAYMQMILNIGESVGQSFIVDEHSQLVATGHESFVAGDKKALPILASTGRWHKKEGHWFYTQVVRDNELYLTHCISQKDLLIAGAKASLVQWLLVLLGTLLGFVAILMYSTALKNKRLMLIDPLTKLFNRRGFYTLLQPIYSNLQRNGETFAVLMVDIDFFKKVNDQYGHGVGDQVLLSVARIIQRTNRESAICSRWGGEEFLIFSQDNNQESVLYLAQRIIDAIAKSSHSEKHITVTVSIGICVSQAAGHFEKAVDLADHALYQAKSTGRNRAVLYQDNK